MTRSGIDRIVLASDPRYVLFFGPWPTRAQRRAEHLVEQTFSSIIAERVDKRR